MPKIRTLSTETVNKIAAGEVVERPLAVVKELVENSIDAKAGAITVEIKEGGISFIRITDNGCGIAKEDIPLAFASHATSKIERVEDLLTVTSLGFRGEALSSIAAVTQLEMLTKEPGALKGSRYAIQGGKEGTIEEVGCPEGTTFLIHNLFYNTPARRKFLKTPATEGSYIQEYLERMAISHPEIAFKFVNNQQLKIHTAGNGNTKDAIYHIYGRDITSALLPVSCAKEWEDAGMVSMEGFVGKPLVSRGNRAMMNYFINGRYIKSTLIQKAIEEAYKPYNMQHRYPFTYLFFTMDASLLDVNIHPTKMEVRFSREQDLYHLIYEGLKETLAHKDYVVPVHFGPEQPKKEALQKRPKPGQNAVAEEVLPYKVPEPDIQEVKGQEPVQKAGEEVKVYDIKEQEADKQEVKKQEANEQKVKVQKAVQEKGPEPFEKKRRQESARQESMEQLDLFESQLLKKERADSYKIVGQIFGTYWIVQQDDQMYMIDQHAAHEKVLYEEFMESFANHQVTSQMVNPPLVVSLSAAEEELLEEHAEAFLKMGFVIEPFGGKEYALSGVPANLPGIGEQDIFMEMLGSLMDTPKIQKDLLYDKIASMSCKAAVKGNTKLPASEAQELIHKLMALENPYHCPHGRPTIIRMSKQEIEKRFKRII